VISFHDPYVTRWRLPGEDLDRVPDLDDALRAADVVLVLQPHASYDLDAVAAASTLVLDTRGRLPHAANVEHL
jgi:UDP-N-acetyl-D-mannosaminuronate dehydrogenase